MTLREHVENLLAGTLYALTSGEPLGPTLRQLCRDLKPVLRSYVTAAQRAGADNPADASK